MDNILFPQNQETENQEHPSNPSQSYTEWLGIIKIYVSLYLFLKKIFF